MCADVLSLSISYNFATTSLQQTLGASFCFEPCLRWGTPDSLGGTATLARQGTIISTRVVCEAAVDSPRFLQLSRNASLALEPDI
jgi:hypothetical protein